MHMHYIQQQSLEMFVYAPVSWAFKHDDNCVHVC